MLKRELLVGVDLGTSSIKALFISTTGEVVARIERKLNTSYQSGGVAEQDANDYWQGLKEIFSEAKSFRDQVIAIGLSGQTPSVVCVDESGDPTFPVMIWQDNRAVDQANELAEHFGNPVAVVGTSLPWAPSGTPAKLYWLSSNFPEVVKKTKWVLQPKDYVGFKLTGKAISDPWSTKGICNVLSTNPIPEVFEKIGWDSSVTPELKAGTESRGKLTPQALAELGLSNNAIEVSVGLSDAMCGMLSIGALTKPQAFIITGTSAIVGISTNADVEDAAGLYVIPKTCAPMNVVYGPTQSSGSAVEWAANLFGISIDELMQSAAGADIAAVPVFLPYLSGERAPIWRTDIRGSFNFVDVMSSKNEFLAAVLEGISFAERSVLDAAAATLQTTFSEITLGGHAGNDHRWDNFRLRTLGTLLIRKTDIDSTTRGSAMLALVLRTGSLADSVKALEPTSEISSPKGADIDYAQKKYQDFLILRKITLDLIDNRN